MPKQQKKEELHMLSMQVCTYTCMHIHTNIVGTRWPCNNATTRSLSQLDKRFKLSGLNEITISDKSPQKCVRTSSTEPMHMWNAHKHIHTQTHKHI